MDLQLKMASRPDLLRRTRIDLFTHTVLHNRVSADAKDVGELPESQSMGCEELTEG
jgi:hypothetical protein